MQEVQELVARVTPIDATVLVCGESGKGPSIRKLFALPLTT